MSKKTLKSIMVFLILVSTSQAFSKEASIKIISPADGAKLKGSLNNKLVFDVAPGPKGDHVHVYVDDKEPIVLRQLKGEYTFKKLEAGNRNICLKLVDKNHTPVGVEKCTMVSVE